MSRIYSCYMAGERLSALPATDSQAGLRRQAGDVAEAASPGTQFLVELLLLCMSFRPQGEILRFLVAKAPPRLNATAGREMTLLRSQN